MAQTINKTQKSEVGEPDEQKSDKPKVLYRVTYEMWDDGEITGDIVEMIQGARGRPKAWRLNPSEFATSVKAQLSEDPAIIATKILESMNIDAVTYARALVSKLEKAG